MSHWRQKMADGAEFWIHGLQTPSEEIAFTAQPKIKSQSQILFIPRANAFYIFSSNPADGVFRRGKEEKSERSEVDLLNIYSGFFGRYG